VTLAILILAFQQAKKPGGEPQFLQIVAKDGSANPNKSKPKAEPKLTRVAFKVSRLMEFCTIKELQNQTGHSAYDWALVVLISRRPSCRITSRRRA
jgi:hypothetical protein